MSQDTRKDKRAKVVSLNVRYKSATVDEFIENHSHDVSRGGIFVKTPTPFPPGTLLKFEIRLAGDKSVIAGVGRVVWKREPTQAGSDCPAGMGVKFIKIDDPSRTLIDWLVTQKADAGSAYTSEPAAMDADEAASAAPAGPQPSTLRGLVAAKSVEPGVAPGPSPVNVPAPSIPSGTKLPVPPPVAGAPVSAPGVPPGSRPGVSGALPRPAPPVGSRPGTMMGVGPQNLPKPSPPSSPKPADAPAAAAPPPEPAKSEPKPAGPVLSAAARKATMMGMGIGGAPGGPFAPPPAPAPAAANESSPADSERPTPSPGSPPPAPPKGGMFGAVNEAEIGPSESSPREPTVMKQAAELLEEALKEAGGSLEEIGNNPLFSHAGEKLTADVAASRKGGTAVMAAPNVPKSTPSPLGAPTPAVAITPTSIAGAVPPSTGGVPPSAGEPSKPIPSLPGFEAQPTSARQAEGDEKKGGALGLVVLFVVLLVVVGGGVFAYTSGRLSSLLGEPPAPTAPVPTAAPSATTSTAASAATGAPDAATTAAKDAGPGAEGGAAAIDLDGPTDAGADAMAADGGIDAGAGAKAIPNVVPVPMPRPRPPAPRPPPVETNTPSTATEPPPAPPPAPTPTPKPDPETP